jgi:hypothetical protein
LLSDRDGRRARDAVAGPEHVVVDAGATISIRSGSAPW